MTSETKALVLVYKIQVIGETNMSEEKEEPHSEDMESSKVLKDK